MTTLIERGAVALLHQKFPQSEWGRIAPIAQKDYLRQSRACLEAFRVLIEKNMWKLAAGIWNLHSAPALKKWAELDEDARKMTDEYRITTAALKTIFAELETDT